MVYKNNKNNKNNKNSKNSKNSKKKINDLKPVIKTSYKKVNVNSKKRKGNTKKIGGSMWDKFKEGAEKTLGRYKGKGVKVGDEIEFLSRQQRGLSRFKIGQNYRSGKQIENRIDYMTKRINEQKQIFTKVNNKLAGKQVQFDMAVKNRFEKLEIEIATETAELEKKLAKGKIKKLNFDEEIKKLSKKKDETLNELNIAKKKFLEKHKKLIKKVEDRKKNLIKMSDRYEPHIKKLTLKLRTKVRKSNKFLDRGLYRSCKNLPKETMCFDRLKKCRDRITKEKIIDCMKINELTMDILDKNILKTKLYTSPSQRIKIKARSERIKRLHETSELMESSKVQMKYVSDLKQETKDKLQKIRTTQENAQKLKTSKIYGSERNTLSAKAKKKIEKEERDAIIKEKKNELERKMEKSIRKGEETFNMFQQEERIAKERGKSVSN